MKKYIIIFYLLLFSNLYADININFIDVDKAINLSKPGKSLLKQLDKINKDNKSNIIKEEEIIKTKENKLIAQKNIISAEEFQSSVSKLRNEIDKHNKDKRKIFSDFEKIKIDNMNKFLKEMNNVLIKYSEENEISIILKKKDLVIGKTTLDITNDVIKIIDKEIMEFEVK
jgi:outer membrane protein